jgi:phage baseplate assembly protein W
MADGTTYGIKFPFEDSLRGDYLQLTEFQAQQIRSDLIFLLLTRKGSRYYLPEFGTRLYEFIFEPNDGLTFQAIESDIRDSINQFLPNLLVNQITIEPADQSVEVNSINEQPISNDPRLYDLYRVPGRNTGEYTAKIKVDYSVNAQTFAQSDFVIINI